jgi:hypothetical protein
MKKIEKIFISNLCVRVKANKARTRRRVDVTSLEIIRTNKKRKKVR